MDGWKWTAIIAVVIAISAFAVMAITGDTEVPLVYAALALVFAVLSLGEK